MAVAATVAAFSDSLTSEFTWRVKEISGLKLALDTAQKQKEGQLHRTLLRASVPILYAHWEGYVKVAAQKYLSYVATKRLKFRNLGPNFFLIRNLPNVRRAVSASVALIELNDVLNRIIESLDDTNRGDQSKHVNTKSNLSSSVFAEVCYLLGINAGPYEQHYDFLDKILLPKRNFIAHGEDVPVTDEEFKSMGDRVIEMLRSFRTDLENAVASNAFRTQIKAVIPATA